MSMSSGFRISAMFTMEETETLPSLILSAAMCEWQSIMPGMTNCPAASITGESLGNFAILYKDGAVLNRSVRNSENGGVFNHDDGGRVRRRGGMRQNWKGNHVEDGKEVKDLKIPCVNEKSR